MDVLCEALESIASDLELRAEPKADTSQEELMAVRQKIAVESKRLDKLMELYMADAITIDEFRERNIASKECMKQLEAREKELAKMKPSPQQMASTIKEAIRMLQDDDVPAAEKNSALKSFIDRIEYEFQPAPL